jgi:histidine triad (HIT) family protein
MVPVCSIPDAGFASLGPGLTGHWAPAIEETIAPEDKMPAYDQDNIFAKILRGEIPCYKVYEDDKALAFLDIMPRAPGHALVIPKAPARNILDVAPDDLAHVMKIAQRIAKISVNVFGADGVTLQQFSENAGGQIVFHLHVHVIPRKEGIALKPPASVKEAPEVLKDQAAKLAAALAQA